MRQRVQQRVAVGHGGVPAEHGRVQPAVAVRELHALGAGRGPRRVVDGAGGGPRRPPMAPGSAPGGAGANSSASSSPSSSMRTLADTPASGALELGVDEEHRGAGVLHDVADLLGVEPEVDGDEHPAEAAHPEERDEQASRVGAHDGHPLARAHAHGVEGQGHAPGPVVHLGVGDGRRASPPPRARPPPPRGSPWTRAARSRKSPTLSGTCMGCSPLPDVQRDRRGIRSGASVARSSAERPGTRPGHGQAGSLRGPAPTVGAAAGDGERR